MKKNRKYAVIGKLFQSKKVGNNKIELREGINSMIDNSKNVKVLRVLYPDGRVWYEKTLKKNQDISKLFLKEEKFIKSSQY